MVAKIRIETDGFMAATKTDLRNVQRDTFHFVGLFWHRNFKAVRFTKRGATLLKYAPRSGEPGSGRRFKGSYSEAKLKKRSNGQGVAAIGEVKPNVWSGRSRALAMAARKVEAKAQNSGRGSVDCIVNAPALNFKNPKSNVHPRVEFERTFEGEVRAMESAGIRQFEKKLTNIRKRKTLRR